MTKNQNDNRSNQKNPNNKAHLADKSSVGRIQAGENKSRGGAQAKGGNGAKAQKHWDKK